MFFFSNTSLGRPDRPEHEANGGYDSSSEHIGEVGVDGEFGRVPPESQGPSGGHEGAENPPANEGVQQSQGHQGQ